MNMIIKITIAFVCVSSAFLASMAQLSKQNSKKDVNMNVVMTVLTVTNDTVRLELHNQGSSTSKFETFGTKSKLIKLRFPVYETLEDGKWQEIKIGYCGTGMGSNLLELPPGKKQNVVVDITILKDLIIFPATIRVKVCDKISSKDITSNEFIIKKL